jgi:hypothetical protein
MNELPSDVDRLLHAERGSVPPAPAGARERVLSRLSSTLGGSTSLPLPLTSPAAPVATAGLSVAARWALALVLGGGLPLLSYLVLAPLSRRPAAPSGWPASVVAVAPTTAPAPAVPEVVAPAAPSTPVAVPAVAIVTPARDRRLHVEANASAIRDDDGADGSLAAERSLLEGARAALALGNTAEALALCRRHERSFAAGQLVEERESIAVRALVSAGQAGPARARAQAFRQRFPRSMFLPAVDAVLQ